ncbi:hypothetical protein EV385_6708 [Krasilnikovia cinnamomea]|uniref:Uncharacterized protein n=1 Tax=Krasilnikovia cinnamomea TaxID=349313 RepID=A0A4Q7Z7Y8_9ACTN|nr:hypothetical protein [Krasilnikovia cinnamomea]RZU46632.1 hypothetical protein EV385_6708 [Krasilnikovia cinnamomea]
MTDLVDEDSPATVALTRLVTAGSALAAAQARHADACTEVLEQVRQARARVDSPLEEQFLALLRLVYWQHPEVQATALTQAAGFAYPAQMTAAIGPVPTGITCDGCGTVLMRTSRSWQMPEGIRRGMPWSCPACWAPVAAARQAEWDARQRRWERIEAARVSGPATDWRVAVTLVLAYPPVTGGGWDGYEAARLVSDRLAHFATDALVSMTVNTALDLLDAADQVVLWNAGAARRRVRSFTALAPQEVLDRLRRRAELAREAAAAEPDA